MSETTEYMGFTIRKIGPDSYAVLKENKRHTVCITEYEARGWINRYRKLLSNNARLRQVIPNSVKLSPNAKAKPKANIIAIEGQAPERSSEKYIKIISKKNQSPELDIQNLDPNEVLGLMKRAEYIITNHVLRNGTI